MDNQNQLIATPQELIHKRISIRNYQPQDVDATIIEQIQTFSNNIERLFDTRLRVEIMYIPSLQADTPLKLGTYGVIRGARHFIAAVHPKGKLELLNAGYILEQIVLFATSFELGTCWLAGTFNRSAFANAMHVSTEETLPVIISLGYPRDNSLNLIDSIFRNIARSRSRKSWEQIFFDQDIDHPLSKSAAGEYERPLEMVRLAPSASNRQPWRVIRQGNTFRFYIFRSQPNNRNIPFFNLPYVDLGIAMAHFELTAAELGLQGKWEIESQPPSTQMTELTYVVTWKALQPT